MTLDLHTPKQQVAVLDTATGEVAEQELLHAGDTVEHFSSALPRPVTVGIESTGSARWFHALLQRLGHTLIVGEAAKIRAMVVRKTKTDRRDSALALAPAVSASADTCHLGQITKQGSGLLRWILGQAAPLAVPPARPQSFAARAPPCPA